MQQMRVHNPAFVPLEETSVTQDREARNERRWETFLTYAMKLDSAKLVMHVIDGRPVTWRRCKVRTAVDATSTVGKREP